MVFDFLQSNTFLLEWTFILFFSLTFLFLLFISLINFLIFFLIIVDAIQQGKVIFNNIKNFLRFQLTTSIAAMLLTAACSLLDLPLALNPTQILWINIIMDGPPAQSLTFEKYADVEKMPPRNPKAPLLNLRLIVKIIISAVVIVCGTIYSLLHDIPAGTNLAEMNDAPILCSTISFTTFVFFQLFSAVNCRSLTKSVFHVGVGSNKILLITIAASFAVQMLVIYVPFLQAIFKTTGLSLAQLGFCTVVSSSVWIVDEIIKAIQRYN